MKILHICAGWQKWNGAANIARMIMDEQRREGHEVSSATWAKVRELRAADEVWIHCGWLPCLWWAAVVCFLTRIPRAKRVAEGDALAGVRRRGAECAERILKWMPEACYDPVRLKFHGWKKWLVGPIERWCLRRCNKIVATCVAEKGWIEKYLGKRCPAVEVTDIKRFFELSRVDGLTRIPRAKRVAEGDALAGVRRKGAECAEDEGKLPSADVGLHLLYLGRRHPLKGVEYLEKAVAELNSNPVNPVNPVQKTSTRSTRLKTSAYSASQRLCVKIISNAFGEELEKVWDWCDVLVLPTLSDNFGLVVAEALERGKRVITTDGAPAWEEGLSRVERVEGLTQRRRDAECAEMFSRVERVERVDGGMWSGYGGRLIYLKGYRDGTDETRVELLKKAIEFEQDSFLKCD